MYRFRSFTFTQYSFTVRAVDESGNVSAPSNTLVVTTLRESIRVNSNMALFEDKIYQDYISKAEVLILTAII